MWKDMQNLILFNEQWRVGVINLLHLHLEWFICSNIQAFLHENTLKYYLGNE